MLLVRVEVAAEGGVGWGGDWRDEADDFPLLSASFQLVICFDSEIAPIASFHTFPLPPSPSSGESSEEK